MLVLVLGLILVVITSVKKDFQLHTEFLRYSKRRAVVLPTVWNPLPTITEKASTMAHSFKIWIRNKPISIEGNERDGTMKDLSSRASIFITFMKGLHADNGHGKRELIHWISLDEPFLIIYIVFFFFENLHHTRRIRKVWVLLWWKCWCLKSDRYFTPRWAGGSVHSSVLPGTCLFIHIA